MLRWCLVLMLCSIAMAGYALDGESFDDPALQARYRELTHVLRCPKCQNETIAESPAGVAADLSREVRRMLKEGKTDEEILRFMTDRYGDFILYRPPFTTRTVLLWLAPGLLLGGALIAVFVIIRRRTQLPVDLDTHVEKGTGSL